MLDPSTLWRDGPHGPPEPPEPPESLAPPGSLGPPESHGLARQPVPSGLPAPSGLPRLAGLAGLPESWEESPQQRGARVQQLAQLVKSGAYAVHSHRLAQALLEWDPRRGNARQSVEVADRRRAYMREYMRRRRAQLPAEGVQPVPLSQASQSPAPENGPGPGDVRQALWHSG